MRDTVETGVDDAIDPITEAPAAEELDDVIDDFMIFDAESLLQIGFYSYVVFAGQSQLP